MGSRLANSNPFTAPFQTEHELNLESAKRLEQDANYQAKQRRKMADGLVKDQMTAAAASGVEIDSSVREIMKQDRQEAEIEAMNIAFSGKLRAAELRRRSALQRDQATLGFYKDVGKFALEY